MCVKSASASGSEEGFAFVGGWGCGFGGFGSLCPVAAGWPSPLSFAFCSFASVFARDLFDFFGFAFVVVAASGIGVVVLLPLFVGEPPPRLSVVGFSFPDASSLPFPFPFPSFSRFSSIASAVFSISFSPTFCGAGDESCKNIPALLETCFFFPYTLAGFFGGRWVSIVSVVVGPWSVAFFVAWDLGGGGVDEVGWIEGVRGCRGNGFARDSGNPNCRV